MPLKDKIKHMLHPHGHKKADSTSNTSSSTTTSTAAAGSDPNRPPNARDPGFRKSFTLGSGEGHDNHEALQADHPPIEPVAAKEEVAPPPEADVDSRKMYTLEKYGEDYLAISPRTNATVPENPTMNRGLSNVSELDQEQNAKKLGELNAQPGVSDLGTNMNGGQGQTIAI